MPQWEDILRDHRVHSQLAELVVQLDQAVALGVLDTNTAEGLVRLQSIRSLVANDVKRMNAVFVPIAAVDAVAMELDSIRGELAQFIENQQPTHVANANSRAEQLLTLMPQLMVGPVAPPSTKKEFNAALQASRDLTASLTAMMKSTVATSAKLTAEVDSARNRLTSEWDSIRERATKEAQSLHETLNAEASELRARLSSETESARTQTAELTATTIARISGEFESLKASLSSQSESLGASVAAIASSVNAIQQRVEAQIGDQQTQFASAQVERERVWSESQRERQQRATALVEETTLRLQTLISESTTKFSEAQETRSNNWSEWQRDRQEKFTTLFAESSARIAELAGQFDDARKHAETSAATELAQLRSDFVGEAETLRKEMAAKKDEIIRLAEIIGDSGMTAGYLRAARVARNSGWLWQAACVLTTATYGWVALTRFLPGMDHSFEWGPFAGRLLVSLAAGGLATYAGFQADRYLKVERQNRKVALDLAAFGPFVAQLPPADQATERVSLGRRTFGQPADFGLNDGERTPATVIDVVLKDSKLKDALIERLSEYVRLGK